MSRTQTYPVGTPQQGAPGAIDLESIEISNRGIVCDNLKKAEDIARYRSKAGMLPLVGQRDNRKPMPIEQAALIIAYGGRFGFDDSWSLKYICIINNQPSVWGAGVSSLLLSSGLMTSYRIDYPDAETCVVRGMRKGLPDECLVSFHSSEFSSVTLNNPTLKDYKRDHLTWKALARFARLYFADALGGMELTEDLLDSIEVAPRREPIRPTVRVQPQAETPPVDEPMPEQADLPPPNERQAASPGELISEPQRKRLFAIANKSGIDISAIKDWMKNVYGFASSNDVTRDVYDEICRKIESGNLGEEPEPGSDG